MISDTTIMKNVQKRRTIVTEFLRSDSRSKLTVISKATRIPVSTVFEVLKDVKTHGAIKKFTVILNFDYFKLNSIAEIFIKFKSIDNRSNIIKFLSNNKIVNCIKRINNGWDFLIEVVAPSMMEVEQLMEDLNLAFPITKHQTHYVLDDVLRENVLTLPEISRSQSSMQQIHDTCEKHSEVNQ